ncbi:MAG: SCO family protein [Thermoleophilaceae bacterium]|nr:SCO family protein [Thermoleophilaceae bacterium]
MNPRLVLALVTVAVAALAVVIVVAGSRPSGIADTPPSGFEGATLPPDYRAPDFRLRDQDGEPISIRALRGRPVAVTFLYTECDDTCPVQAQQIKGALDQLGHDVPVLAISVDPANDTAALARKFNNEVRMTGRMDWVLGSEAELRPIWDGFAIQPQLEDADHQARIVLVDADGFQRIGFPLDQTTPERIAHDIARLEAE